MTDPKNDPPRSRTATLSDIAARSRAWVTDQPPTVAPPEPFGHLAAVEYPTVDASVGAPAMILGLRSELAPFPGRDDVRRPPRIPDPTDTHAGPKTRWTQEELALLRNLAVVPELRVTSAAALQAEYTHATGKERSWGAFQAALRGLAEPEPKLRDDRNFNDLLVDVAAHARAETPGVRHHLEVATASDPPTDDAVGGRHHARWSPEEEIKLVDALRRADPNDVESFLACAPKGRERIAISEHLRRLRNAGELPQELVPAATTFMSLLRGFKRPRGRKAGTVAAPATVHPSGAGTPPGAPAPDAGTLPPMHPRAEVPESARLDLAAVAAHVQAQAAATQDLLAAYRREASDLRTVVDLHARGVLPAGAVMDALTRALLRLAETDRT